MIRISNVQKSFNKTEVLKDISIDIEDGEIFGIIGQSGAGKSTLLRCINLLETIGLLIYFSSFSCSLLNSDIFLINSSIAITSPVFAI